MGVGRGADTQVPRYGTVRGTNRPLFPTNRPESDADWDRLYYGGTNAAQERGGAGVPTGDGFGTDRQG